MKNTAETTAKIAIVDYKIIENLIYIIRGQKVMLDVDLAKIYGYEMKNFNRQIKNNIDRFDDNFMFPLTREEVELVRCKIFTSRNETLFAGQSPHSYFQRYEGLYF